MDTVTGSSSRESEETGTVSFYTTSHSFETTSHGEDASEVGHEIDYYDDDDDDDDEENTTSGEDEEEDDDDDESTEGEEFNTETEGEGDGDGDDDAGLEIEDGPTLSNFTSTDADNSSPERVSNSAAASAQSSVASSSSNKNNHKKPQSEWDKALMQGKPSTGKAADFFSLHRRTSSADGATAAGALHQMTPSAAATTAGNISKKPPRPAPIDVTAVATETVSTNSAGGGLEQPPPPPPPAPQADSARSLSDPVGGGRPPISTTSSVSPSSIVGSNNNKITTKGSVVVHVQSNLSSTNNSPSNNNANNSGSNKQASNKKSNNSNATEQRQQPPAASVPTLRQQAGPPDLSAGVLPDVLMNMRQKIESLTLFDSDIIRLSNMAGDGADDDDDDPFSQESRESLKRSSQQSISAAVLVSLAHKRYERRRLAAMEIEKVVRSLVALHQQHQQQGKNSSSNNNNGSPKNELERIYAILLLLSDDFCRSTNEDARKGGTVALAACAIGLKRADDHLPAVMECRDLILASVVHACQDHSQRVRYYATESLFNVVKVIPSLAVQHFFILFEVLRSLFADVDPDVRSGAELLDKKLKEVIVGAMNAGVFTADACVPVFGRFVYMRNKATKRLTLTWLQELNEKLIGAPILEFLHLFLGGVIEMVADPSVAIRQSALAFLQSVLPKLLVVNSGAMDDAEGQGMKVDFDKILQALVTTLEHANPFVRKVAMYWMSRIVKAHMIVDKDADDSIPTSTSMMTPDGSFSPIRKSSSASSRLGGTATASKKKLSAASISVRNSVPHVLPGVLLSVGDNFVSTNSATAKDAFLPDQTTRSLAEQTNECIQDAVRRDGPAFVEFTDGLIVALREELASPGGFGSKNAPAIERTPFRMDVVHDGTGIETAGWFRASRDRDQIDTEAMVASRLCALHWVIVLYESVVPDPLKADYAREFVFAIIHQLADSPPETIVYKSLEVLARITVPVEGEEPSRKTTANVLGSPVWSYTNGSSDLEDVQEFPMTDTSVAYAMKILDPERRRLKSRDRQVFSALIQLHAFNEHLLANLSNVLTYMCRLQPPEFVMVSFAVELDRFIKQRTGSSSGAGAKNKGTTPSSSDLKFLSAFIQHMNHVLLNADETKKLREVLKDCISSKKDTEGDHQRSRLFHILLHSFSHNIVATLSLCLWAGAYRTASLVLNRIDPLDITLILLLEADRLIELLERPLFRHLHVRMLERDQKPTEEGSGVMLFQLLKSLLMILPQSACYRVLRDRLVSVSRFRQSTIPTLSSSTTSRYHHDKRMAKLSEDTKTYVARVQHVRDIHCSAMWENVRQESLEMPKRVPVTSVDADAARREWLGYASKEEASQAEKAYREGKKRTGSFSIEEIGYHDFETAGDGVPRMKQLAPNDAEEASSAGDDKEEQEDWKQFWSGGEDKS